MTSPRDALRALERKLSLAIGIVENVEPDYDIHVRRVKEWRDELAAIVSQMDSEPTVAQWREAVQWIAWHPQPENSHQWLDRVEQRARELAAKDKDKP